MPKIKGKKTTRTYVYEQVEDWIDKSGLANRHFVNESTMRSMVMRCIAQARRMTVVWRDAQARNSKSHIIKILNDNVPTAGYPLVPESNFEQVANRILTELKGKI